MKVKHATLLNHPIILIFNYIYITQYLFVDWTL